MEVNYWQLISSVNMWWWVLLAAVVLMLIGLWLGSTNRAVFYHNKLDAFIAIASTYAVGAACYFICNSAGGRNQVMLAYLLISTLILYNAYKSFRYNNPFYGLCVFLGRIMMSVVAIFAIPGLNRKTYDDRDGGWVNELFSLAFTVAIWAWLAHLVNKESVLTNRKYI